MDIASLYPYVMLYYEKNYPCGKIDYISYN